MNRPGAGGRWALAASVLAIATAVLVASAIQEPAPSAVLTNGLSNFKVPPTTSTTTTIPTPTTVPEVESLIPLTVDALADDVAQSVGFVLSQQGTGSGVVISDDLLVTNAHVAWPDTTVSLVFRNGATFQGRVIALDPFVDLAVVDISRMGRKPPPISLGSTEGLDVGDDLYVIGYPSPDEFTPEPTVDVGEILGFVDWEFSGVSWFTIDAPAIGGQSGGAVVDPYGRAVGISTFGSSASLTSIAIDDVLIHVDRLLSDSQVRGLGPRSIPHSGARRSNAITLEGEWDQQLLFGWFLSDADVRIAWEGGDGDLQASTIDGVSIVEGGGRVEFFPVFAFPVVVTADSEQATGGSLESSLPLIAYADPDHGKTLELVGAMPGVFEVGGDRDFFYVDLEAGEQVSLTVESAARTVLAVYGPGGDVIASDRDQSGFIGSNASADFTALDTGRHIVAVESLLSTVAGYTVVTE